MIHIKRWIFMLVLVIMLVPTARAETYSSNDNIIPSDIVLTFENYFSDSFYFQYFSYYNNNFPCYYAIDQSGNYYNIVTEENGTYSYIGLDENFNVDGPFVYKKTNLISIVLVGLALLIVFKVISYVF